MSKARKMRESRTKHEFNNGRDKGKTKTIKGRRDGSKTERRKGKHGRQMWVNETDNGKQWCVARMIVFRRPRQIDRRTELC